MSNGGVKKLLKEPEIFLNLFAGFSTLFVHFLIKFHDLLSKFFVLGKQMTEPHKCSHNLDVDFNCAVGAENTRKHSDAEFRECIWWGSSSAMVR